MRSFLTMNWFSFQFLLMVQVYLLGDFAIKLCVEEGGPWVAIDGLRSEVL